MFPFFWYAFSWQKGDRGFTGKPGQPGPNGKLVTEYRNIYLYTDIHVIHPHLYLYNFKLSFNGRRNTSWINKKIKQGVNNLVFFSGMLIWIPVSLITMTLSFRLVSVYLSNDQRVKILHANSNVVIQNKMSVFALISLPVLSLELWNLKRFAPWKGIRIPKSGKFLLLKSRK